ncbi:hypothetical protein D9619_008321 [Psilocybe cf. subviscida]|uniref:Uncharacterized protein n=1 Tax=Psilocybe cf. subviscida TaxID=2480587 RepID=A0A8H5F0Q4_9AGAR|nr:hypothetical protein D9619_008321 [Psilocybe cf. subviscida]
MVYYPEKASGMPEYQRYQYQAAMRSGDNHLGASLARVRCAFIQFGAENIGGDGTLTSQKLRAINSPLYLLRATVYSIQTLVGDAFILYRLYLVWNGNGFLFYPLVMTFLGSFATAVGSLQDMARWHHDTVLKPIFEPQQEAWVISFLVLTLFTNTCATALIAGRIWWVPLRTTQMTIPGAQCDMTPTRVAIMESGAIYSISLIVLMGLYLKGSYAQNVVFDAMPQVIGIVFSLVIVRVALGVGRAYSIKSQSAQIQQLNLSVNGMLESQKGTLMTNPMESWHSRSTQMFKEGGEKEFIACEVEVIQSSDTDSMGGDSGQTNSDHGHALVLVDRYIA